MQEYFDANRAHWDELTPIHAKSEFYDVEGFRRGKSTLMAIELEELGDVSGKSLLHLQCHFGLDTMSWARCGASATGADFSPEAITLARSLAAELGIEATFVLSNLYDLPDALDKQFDIVFTSYGVLFWLPDVTRWAEIIAHFLKPGGTFYIVDGHPVSHVFDDCAGITELRVHYPYFDDAPHRYEPDDTGSYADEDARLTTHEVGWQHTLGDIVTALVSSGLRLEFLHEFPQATYRILPFAEKHEDGWWRLKGHDGDIPLLFSLKATMQ